MDNQLIIPRGINQIDLNQINCVVFKPEKGRSISILNMITYPMWYKPNVKNFTDYTNTMENENKSAFSEANRSLLRRPSGY